jgi:hypothetical protein
MDVLIEFYFGSKLTVEADNSGRTIVFGKVGTLLWILLETQGQKPIIDERQALCRIRNNRFLTKLSSSSKLRNLMNESKCPSSTDDG